MKRLFKYMILCLFLVSCKKDQEVVSRPQKEANQKKYEVTFNASDFGQQVSGIAKGNNISDAPLEDMADYFIYFAYNSAGEQVTGIRQFPDGSTRVIVRAGPNNGVEMDAEEVPPYEQTPYGYIKDFLTPGEYTIVMLASKAQFGINWYNSSEYRLLALKNAGFIYERGLISISRAKDTFFKKFKVTVGETNQVHDVVLDRIVGKAEIHVLDSKPGTTYKFLFVRENESFSFNNELPEATTTSDSDPDNEQYIESVVGEENLTYSKFILNTVSLLDIVIKVYENGTLTASKTIKDVRFYKNKRTILRGNVYTTQTNSTGFNVTVNDEFDSDSVEVSF
jgi:hypothetical protein